MKKTKVLAVVLVIAVIISAFVACSSKPTYNDKEVDFTEIVTDEAGQVVTEEATNEAGATATQGTTSQAATNASNSTTKKQNGNTTITKQSTTKSIAPVGQNNVSESDIKVEVVLPFISDADQGTYTLNVKIGNDTKSYEIKEGCRGQKVTIVIPKKYNGKTALFTIKDTNYKREATIKAGLVVNLETITVVEGVDD